jgi:hypothetical protein
MGSKAFGQIEAAALQQLGFAADTLVTRHEGQDTASRSVIFRNAYLELLWTDSTASVSPESARLLAELRQASSWRATGASPFGLGLRRVEGPDEYGVPAQRYRAAWMEPGSYIAVLKQPQEELSIDVFVVPDYMSLTAWISFIEQQAPALLQHANGSRRVTSVHCPGYAARTVQPGGALW